MKHEARIMNQESKIKNKQKGFTIVELLVAMSVFGIVISIAIAGFTRSLRIQRATTLMMAINDNASLTLEQMMREIRVGENFRSIGESELTFDRFIDGTKFTITYKLLDEAVQRGTGDPPSSFEPITATNVKITSLKFILLSNGRAPRITISLGVGSRAPDLEKVVTNIQTTVSARNI